MPETVLVKPQSLAIWIFSSSLHMACGLLLFSVASPNFYLKHAETLHAKRLGLEPPDSSTPSPTFSFNALMYLGIGHGVVGLLVALVIMLGNVLYPKLKASLKFLGILQSLLCIGTTIAIEGSLGSFHEFKLFEFDKFRLGSDAEAPLESDTAENLTTINNAALIIAAGALTISILALVGYASAVGEDDPPPTIVLTMLLTALTGLAGGGLIFSTSNVAYIAIGSVWAVLSAVVDFLGSLGNYIGKALAAGVQCFATVVVGLFGVALSYVFYDWLSNGAYYDTLSIDQIKALNSQEQETYKYYYIMGNSGSYLVAAMVGSSIIGLLALMLGIYVLYAGITENKIDKEAADDPPSRGKTSPSGRTELSPAV